MKLIHVINGLGKGGAEKLLTETLPLYQKAGYEVTLVQVTSRNVFPEYLDKLNKANIPLHTLGDRNIYNPLNILSLRKFFGKRSFDIVHVHIFPSMYWFPMSFIFKKKKAAWVFTEHNTQNRRWDKWYFKLIDTIIYKRYDAIVAITNDVKKNLGNWIPDIKARIVTIFNGIDVKSFDKISKIEKPQLLSSLHISNPNACLLLMTARFEKQKDHITIIKAMQHLSPDYYLLLAGDGPDKEAMQALAQELNVTNQIKFLGFRADVLSLMKSCDINVLSSNYEGLSGVTLEALCSGRPFLGSDVSGINNVVPDERFLFKAKDDIGLAEKITAILSAESLQQQMIGDSAIHVKEYDIAFMTQKHLDLYQSLLK